MNDRGHVAVMSLVLGVGLLLFAVLVADGGRVLAARARVDEQAHAAARAGAGQLEAGSLLRGEVELDAEAAVEAARRFLADIGASGFVTVSAGQVLVTVDDEVELAVTALFGSRHVSVRGEGAARPALGVAEENDVWVRR